MAVNPLARTGDQNTLKMSDLLRIPVRDRVTAAKTDSSFIQMILNSLTPIEVAKAFPSYYRDAIPDVSNFVTKNIEAKLAAGGMSWHQTEGGNQGTARPGYSGETKTSPNTKPAGVREKSLDEIKDELKKKNIDIDNLHETVGTQGILANDKRSKFLKNASNEQLAKMGFERFETEEGKNMIRVKPFDVEAMTDEEISKKISGKIVAKETATETQKAIIDFANRWGISPEAAAGVFKVESGITNSATNGGHHGIFQLNTDQVDDLSEKAGFGKLTPAQFRQLSKPDQLKVMDKYYEYWKVQPDFFTGDPKTDTAKMWALQFAPGNAKKLDYTNPNVQITGPGQAATVSAGGRGGPVTVGSSMGSLSGGIDYLGEVITRIEGTATHEQIEEYRREQRLSENEKREEEAARYAYDIESPTSSEARVDKTGTTTLGKVVLNESGYAFPVTGKMEHDGHGGTSEFGYARKRLHAGVDLYSTDPETGKLRVGSNAPVTAPLDGKIVSVRNGGKRAGFIMEYQDKNGFIHRFLHTEKNPVNPLTGEPWKVGDSVTQGQTLTHITGSGTMFGQTVEHFDGDIEKALQFSEETKWQRQSWHEGTGSTVNKPHAHYEIRDKKGKLLNPSTIFPEYSGSDKEKMHFASVDDKLKYQLANGEITQAEYDQGIKDSKSETEDSAAQSSISSSIESMVIPNSLNPNLPGGDEAMAGKEELAGVVFHKTPLTLEKLQKGEDPRAPTFGYNTAIVSTYQDEFGNKITEQEWKKLPKGQRSQYTEQAEVHQIRPEDVRPNQIRKTSDPDTPRSKEIGTELNNTNALGIVTIGSDSAAKQEAARKYLAELIATGKMSEEALNSIYGHGEIQNDGGRPFMDPKKTPEGSVMAKAARDNVEEIKQIAEEMKKNASTATAATEAAPEPEQTQTQASVEEEPTEMAQGGFIPEKDNLSVVNDEGKTLAKINQGEVNGGILSEGTGLRVVSNKTRIADDIVERNNTNAMAEQSAAPEAPQQQQTQEKPIQQKNQVMKDDQQWRESSMIDTSYSAGTQVRAFRRSKFMPEGYHFNRATPGSLA